MKWMRPGTWGAGVDPRVRGWPGQVKAVGLESTWKQTPREAEGGSTPCLKGLYSEVTGRGWGHRKPHQQGQDQMDAQ